MKERPVTLTPTEARAGAGLRRLVRPVQPQPEQPLFSMKNVVAGRESWGHEIEFGPSWGTLECRDGTTRELAVPRVTAWECFGQAGDVLWGQEKWRVVHSAHADFTVEYAAGGEPQFWRDGELRYQHLWDPFLDRWRSPLHLPREFARLLLRVTAVSVVRLSALTHEDALAAGFPDVDQAPYGFPAYSYALANLRREWEARWAGKGLGWSSDPWCWRVSVERVETK